jgi:hypothetical protein
MMLACAASFAAALVASESVRSIWTGRKTDPSRNSVTRSEDAASDDRSPAQAMTDSAPDAPGSPDSPSWIPAGKLTLAVDAVAGEEAQRVEVPLYQTADNKSPAWAWSSASSASFLQALKEAGHDVTLQRQLWPLELEDGRQVVVPVEQVVVAPLTAASFQ